MTEQRIVVHQYTEQFEQEVKKLLQDGWRVVPGTVASGERLICFMEKPMRIGPTPAPTKNTGK